MKMQREDLKILIKECLVEIMSECLGGQPLRLPEVHKKTVVQQKQQLQRTHNPVLQEAIKKSAAGSSMMGSIFADTAKTTLPNMIRGEKQGPVLEGASREALVVAQHEPEELFGEETASRWADLAFATAPLPK